MRFQPWLWIHQTYFETKERMSYFFQVRRGMRFGRQSEKMGKKGRERERQEKKGNGNGNGNGKEKEKQKRVIRYRTVKVLSQLT